MPAITNDVAAGTIEKKALAQEIDAGHHGGLPPYTVYIARTIFMHTLAFNEPLKGISPKHLRYSVLSPTTDISFIEEARSFSWRCCIIPDKPKGISKLRFWGQNYRVNRINDLPIFMQQRRSPPTHRPDRTGAERDEEYENMEHSGGVWLFRPVISSRRSPPPAG